MNAGLTDHDKERIAGRLRTLAERQPHIFGASEHLFRLNPVLDEESIAAFEVQHNVVLPPDYRWFLLALPFQPFGDPAYNERTISSHHRRALEQSCCLNEILHHASGTTASSSERNFTSEGSMPIHFLWLTNLPPCR